MTFDYIIGGFARNSVSPSPIVKRPYTASEVLVPKGVLEIVWLQLLVTFFVQYILKFVVELSKTAEMVSWARDRLPH
jgi:hypothetical protein